MSSKGISNYDYDENNFLIGIEVFLNSDNGWSKKVSSLIL